ncbi:MAG: aminopeptidase P family N-terminal domain-containing protein, partial [Candidatus Omnitrophica bacterium]|nr:aminopeptidase P family N-terminal domain-containing protein [Candidatus Omnitrophota bacterium]
MNYPSRIEKLQAQLRDTDMSAIWITRAENCQYLIGFRGHAELDVSLLLTMDLCLVIASRLYADALQARELEIRLIKTDLISTMKEVLSQLEVEVLGVSHAAITAKTLHS